MGISHSDIGGYTSRSEIGIRRSKELLLRWAEYSAFTPIMRTHEGNEPQANWQIFTDDDTLGKFGRLTQIFRALGDYSREAVRQNAEEGIPAMRPLFLMFEVMKLGRQFARSHNGRVLGRFAGPDYASLEIASPKGGEKKGDFPFLFFACICVICSYYTRRTRVLTTWPTSTSTATTCWWPP